MKKREYLRVLNWTAYMPADEREQDYFRRAYVRTYSSLFAWMIGFMSLFGTYSVEKDGVLQQFGLHDYQMIVIIMFALFFAHAIGGTALFGKEITWKKRPRGFKNSPMDAVGFFLTILLIYALFVPVTLFVVN